MWTRMQRHSAARLLFRRLGLLALAALVVFAFGSVRGVYEKERDSRELRIRAENERAELEDRRARLEEDVARLGSERGMEEVLRAQYALANEGEGLIVIVEPPSAEPAATSSTVLDHFRSFFRFW